MRHIRGQPAFSNALAVIAPESNFGNFASDIETELLLNGFEHFVVVALANGGQNAGLYTSNQNKIAYAGAIRNLFKLNFVHVWNGFISIDDSNEYHGDFEQWLRIVTEFDKFWRYVYPSRVVNRPPRIELTAKRNPNGKDDDVICTMLAARMLGYWAIGSAYFTSRSNPMNHSHTPTEEISEIERINMLQMMNNRDHYCSI
ncbi:MAG: hypothetical protein AB7P49_04620 [Bdellovibrionales bacterium]